MQRIRETERGLELKDGTDRVTVSRVAPIPGLTGNEITIDSQRGDRRVEVQGRDNIRDFGLWFSNLDLNGITTSGFKADVVTTRSQYFKRLVILAEGLPEKLEDESLGQYETRILGTPTDLTSISTLHAHLGRTLRSTALKNEVTDSRIAIPEGYQPILFSSQRYDSLYIHYATPLAIPLQAATEFGSEIIEGLSTVQKRSIWWQ